MGYLNERDFNAALRDRVKKARKREGLTQKKLASFLGIERDTYSKYESKRATPMPLHLIQHFAQLTHEDPFWVAFGERRHGVVEQIRRRGQAAE